MIEERSLLGELYRQKKFTEDSIGTLKKHLIEQDRSINEVMEEQIIRVLEEEKEKDYQRDELLSKLVNNNPDIYNRPFVSTFDNCLESLIKYGDVEVIKGKYQTRYKLIEGSTHPLSFYRQRNIEK